MASSPDDYYFVTPIESQQDALDKLNSPAAKAGHPFSGWDAGTAAKEKIIRSIIENLGNCLEKK